MTKNLLQQVMMKKVDLEKTHAFDVSGMAEKINSGYLVGRDSKFNKKKTFAPSSITYSDGNGVCPRYWYLAFDGAEFTNSDTPFGVANMTSGIDSHSRIQKAMMLSGIAKIFKDENNEDTTEFKVIYSDPPIFGFGDCMISWNGEDIVGEIKTTNNETFEYRKKAGKPKTDHIEQALIYMKILNKSKGVIIYENKNNHDLLLFPIEVNDHYRKWIDNTFSWMQTVYSSWKNRTLPNTNYRSNAKICKGCPIKETCDNAGTGAISIPSLEGLSEAM